ncbi:MAG: hypothetical protein JBO36_04895 [Candidatus Thiodiazotropha taylori]|nr:hypothetical protein [Candidatus Thiodiazotropha taylori]
MEERIKQLREKTHLDIPIVFLSIMFSLSLDKFSFTVFHVAFTLLIFSLIVSRAMLWNLTSVLTQKSNHFLIVANYAQIALLFAVYYTFGAKQIAVSVFYAAYSIFLLIYVVILCIQLYDFGEIDKEQSWPVAIIFLHSLYFFFAVVSSVLSHGVEIAVVFNIALVVSMAYAFERKAKEKHAASVAA